jgi:heptosyltransferase I
MPPPAAARILVIRPSALGDVARSVPVLASLRATYPQARIDWLVRDSFAPVLAAHPALSNLVLFPRQDFSRWLKSLQVSKVRQYLRTLREPGYDLVFDCQGLARSGLFAWSTGASRRVGYADARELGWLALTDKVRTSRTMHTVDKALALLESVGIPVRRDVAAQRLWTPPAGHAWLAEQPFANRRYVVLAPTSAWPAKQWPAERFAALAQELVRGGLCVVVTGGKSERAHVAPLLRLAQSNPQVFDRVGETDIAGLMATLEHASLVVANDSAALHIAVGFDRPVIGLFGPTDPRLAAPYQRPGDVIQHVQPGDEFYFRDARSAAMMQRIGLDEVLQRAQTLLGI